MTAGIYARISLDRRDGEGVERQLDDCRRLAAERGWSDTAEYIDNDMSAFHGKRRPEYERLLDDLHAQRLTAVVAYHPDRLYRHTRDLEAFVDAVQQAGAEVATVRAGDIDLATSSGRMVARILGAVSRQEAERIGERVARAKQQRTAKGRPGGGGYRAFGLTADRTDLVPAEADALRTAAAQILAGTSWNRVVNDLNATGLRTPTGGMWSAGNLRRMLSAPRVAGLATYQGQIVGDATWPAILDRGTWELIRADTASRGKGRPPSDKHLLTGLLGCSKCNRPLWINTARHGRYVYHCRTVATSTGRGCGGITVDAAGAEDYVTVTITGWLQRPAFATALDAYLAHGDVETAGTRVELDEIERQQVRLARRWAEGHMADAAHDAAAATLAQRQAELEARLAGAPRRPGPKITGAQVAAGWHGLTVPERREAIRIVARQPIVVGPGRDADGRRLAAAERIGLHPAWE